MSPETIRANWAGLRTGNESDLVEVHRHCYEDLFRYGLKCTANEDITRDTINELFLELWDKRATLPEVSFVQSYLLSWYKRKLFRKLHTEKRNTPLEESVIDSLISDVSYEEYIIQLQSDRELQKKLKKGLQQLSPRQRQFIQLRFYEGLKITEIAQQTSLAHRTVYNKLHEALKILRKALSEKK